MLSPDYILSKFKDPVPRYTSYPTAPHFKPELGGTLIERLHSSIKEQERISVYVHVPFCDRLCWFCGCHTKHTLKYDPVEAYVSTLTQEIKLVSRRIGFAPLLGQVHFGGGSPSMLSAEDLSRLRIAFEGAFVIDSDTEISVEIDPSDGLNDTLLGLQQLGMTRASIGVQDFDPEVQTAINRPQTFEQTKSVVDDLRSVGIHSLNIDALYGLPLQDEVKIAKTMEQIVSLAPDRVALFGYAHVPWMKKHQQMIKDEDLPGQQARFDQAELAAKMLIAAGYQKIGIDHFALPTDTLAIAANQKNMRRNFQGYTTDNCEILLPFGASSIGRFQDGYVQNIVPTGQYQAAIEKGELPAAKGMSLSLDDKIRAHIIERLMCDFEIRFNDLSKRFECAQPYIDELKSVASAEEDGLCEADGIKFTIPNNARPYTRIVAARFDAYLNKSGARYSKAV